MRLRAGSTRTSRIESERPDPVVGAPVGAEHERGGRVGEQRAAGHERRARGGIDALVGSVERAAELPVAVADPEPSRSRTPRTASVISRPQRGRRRGGRGGRRVGGAVGSEGGRRAAAPARRPAARPAGSRRRALARPGAADGATRAWTRVRATGAADSGRDGGSSAGGVSTGGAPSAAPARARCSIGSSASSPRARYVRNGRLASSPGTAAPYQRTARRARGHPSERTWSIRANVTACSRSSRRRSATCATSRCGRSMR